MTILTYKDFQGSVNFEDGKLIIQVLHIDDTLITECDAASAAQAAFEDLVEDYLETCKIVGKEPSRPFKGSFNVRISPALHRRVAMAAAIVDKTLNAWVSEALEQTLDREERGSSLWAAGSFRQFALLKSERDVSGWRNAGMEVFEQSTSAGRVELDELISFSQFNR
jgi:predicted HicB family RNase H-like nuclease